MFRIYDCIKDFFGCIADLKGGGDRKLAHGPEGVDLNLRKKIKVIVSHHLYFGSKFKTIFKMLL
jgi:hypothetical protein